MRYEDRTHTLVLWIGWPDLTVEFITGLSVSITTELTKLLRSQCLTQLHIVYLPSTSNKKYHSNYELWTLQHYRQIQSTITLIVTPCWHEKNMHVGRGRLLLLLSITSVLQSFHEVQRYQSSLLSLVSTNLLL